MTHEHGITATPPHTHSFSFFFFNDTATTEIYTLSLHDALPIWQKSWLVPTVWMAADPGQVPTLDQLFGAAMQLFRDRLRSEEHTSELQSQSNLVCRLLLEKKKDDARPGRTRVGPPPVCQQRTRR